jgi:C-terminal processing protease CtpA/Prc
LRAQAENKIARRIPLNAAEFRSLDAGIIGFIAVKPDLARSAMVVKLLPGCPAEQAGIKIGDVILRQTVDPSTVKTLRKPSWLFSCGQADEPCEITIMRQGHVFNVRLAYMNIEDVTDERLRHRLESLVEQAGFKAYHSPERADMSELLESLDDQ